MNSHRLSSCSLSVLLVAVAGQAPCGAGVLIEKELVQQNTLRAFGLTHSSLGNAQLGMSPTGSLVVSGIGSSGLDGVTFPVGDVRGHSMSIDFGSLGALMPGGLVEVFYPYAFGEQTVFVQAQPDGSARAGLGGCPGGDRVWPTCVTVSIIDDGVVVGKEDLLCGETDHFIAGDFGTDPATGEAVGFRMEQDGWNYVHTISLPADTLLSIPGGPSVVGDEVRMSVNSLAPGETPSGPVRVLASNLGTDLVIDSSTLILPGAARLTLPGVTNADYDLNIGKRVNALGGASIIGMAEGQACQSHPKAWFYGNGLALPRAMQVGNLGSSGLDGVSVSYVDETTCGAAQVRCPDGSCADSIALCPSFPLEDRVLYMGGKDPAAPDYLDLSGNGVRAVLRSTGWVGGTSDQALGAMQLSGVRNVADVDVTADFSSLASTLIRAEVYLDGAFIGFHEAQAQQGPVVMGRMGNHPNVCQMVAGGTVGGDSGGPFGYFVTTRDPFTFFAGGQALVGNEVRVLAASAPAPVAAVSELDFTGSNLEPFDFRLESVVDDPQLGMAFGSPVRAHGFGTAIAVSADGQIATVSNLGSSGEDGVSFAMDDATGTTLEFLDGGAFTDGSSFEVRYEATEDHACPSCRPVRLVGTHLQATTPDRLTVTGSSEDPTVPLQVVLYDEDGQPLVEFAMLQTESLQVSEPNGQAIGLSKADSKRDSVPGGPSATFEFAICHLIANPGGGGGTGSGMGVLTPANGFVPGVHSIGIGTALPSAALPCCRGHVTVLKAHDPGGTSGTAGDMVITSQGKKGYDHYVAKSDQGSAQLSTQSCDTGSGAVIWRSVTNIGSSGQDGVSLDLSGQACRAGCPCDDDCDGDVDFAFLRFDAMNGHGGGVGDLKVKVVAKKTPISGGGTGGTATVEAAILAGPIGPELSVTATDHNGAVYVYRRTVSLFDQNGGLLGTHTYNPGETDITRLVVFGQGSLDGRYTWQFADEPNPNTNRIRRRPDLLLSEWDELIDATIPGSGETFEGVQRCEVRLEPVQGTVFDFDQLEDMDLLWAAPQGETRSYLITEEGVARQSAGCSIDFNGDGILDNGDIIAFVQFFLAMDLVVDVNGDGILDNGDIIAFVQAFLAGCD